jgi:hypothetical protein
MDFNFLPERVKKYFLSKFPGVSALAVLRSASTLMGGPGESCLVALPENLCLLYKDSGAEDYTKLDLRTVKGLRDLVLRKEKFNTFLDFVFESKVYPMKFSMLDGKDLEKVVEIWKKISASRVTSETGAPAAGPPPGEGLSPAACFAAALMFLLSSGGREPLRDRAFLERLMHWGADALPAAEKHLAERGGGGEFLPDLASRLSPEQKLCVLANMLDAAMSDGVFHSAEQEAVAKFADAAGIAESDRSALLDAMLVKNNMSVFSV